MSDGDGDDHHDVFLSAPKPAAPPEARRRRQPLSPKSGRSRRKKDSNDESLQLALALSRSVADTTTPARCKAAAQRRKNRNKASSDATPVLVGAGLKKSLEVRAQAFIDLTMTPPPVLTAVSPVHSDLSLSSPHPSSPCSLWDYAASACLENDFCSTTSMLADNYDKTMPGEASTTSPLTDREEADDSGPTVTNDLDATLHEYLRSNMVLYCQILRFEPLDLQELCIQLKRDGIKCSQKELAAFLESRAISFCLPKPL